MSLTVLWVLVFGVGGTLLVWWLDRAAARRRAAANDASLAAVRGMARLAETARNSKPDLKLARRSPGGSGADLVLPAPTHNPLASRSGSAPINPQRKA